MSKRDSSCWLVDLPRRKPNWERESLGEMKSMILSYIICSKILEIILPVLMLELLLELAAGKLFSGGWDFVLCVIFLKRGSHHCVGYRYGGPGGRLSLQSRHVSLQWQSLQ